MNLQDLIAKTTPGEWHNAGKLASHILDNSGRCIVDCPHPNSMPHDEGYANKLLICHMHKTYMELVEALQAIESHQQTTIEPTAEGFQAIARMALTNANTIL